MAHTFEELVNLQRAAYEAHARVLALRDEYGPSNQGDGWSGEQTDAYNEAWRAWRTGAEGVQAAVATHAMDEETPRHEIEVAVKTAARHPKPAER